MSSSDCTWCPREIDFPEAGSLSDQLRFALRYAILAPSGHNMQPWQFRLAGDHVEVRADATRALPVVDPDQRELVMSCGAAVYFLRVALRHFGLQGRVQILPDDGADPDLLATVAVGGSTVASSYDERLFGAILRRRTHRGGFEAASLPSGLRSTLISAATGEDAWIAFPDGAARGDVAALVVEADHTQYGDPEFRREVSTWIRADAKARDGVPLRSYGVPRLLSRLTRRAVSSLDSTAVLANRDRSAVLSAPGLALLGTDGDTREDWMHAGQALAHVLLAAADGNVAARFFNQAVQVPDLRRRLGHVMGGPGVPQLLFGLGPARPRQPTARRPVEAVLA